MAPHRGKAKPPRLPNLTPLNTASMPASSTFVLTETGTFHKDGFSIRATGIQQTPLARSGDFSSLTLEQLEMLQNLGSGSCGAVRLARHRESGRLLALKVINVMADQSSRHQVLNELRLLAGLDHPCLVPLFDAFYLDGHIYMALGYMDGGSLEYLLEAYKPIAAAARLRVMGIPESTMAHILLQVLCALEHLHSVGVVHRDLKPANILLSACGEARVSDFGISKELRQTLGMAKSFVGTAAYMAPERVHGLEYSTASDVWSVGMVCMECTQGAHPLRHLHNYFDLVSELSSAAPSPQLPADLFSPPFIELVSSCLRKDHNGRPSCAELLRHPFLAQYHARFSPSPAATPSESLVAVAASRLREWVGQTFAAPPPPAAHAALPQWQQGDGASSCQGPAEAAQRIQAVHRGTQLRRELEEMQLLAELESEMQTLEAADVDIPATSAQQW